MRSQSRTVTRFDWPHLFVRQTVFSRQTTRTFSAELPTDIREPTVSGAALAALARPQATSARAAIVIFDIWSSNHLNDAIKNSEWQHMFGGCNAYSERKITFDCKKPQKYFN
jgi:hypothetical protein